MKKIILSILMVLIASVCFADGVYYSTIDGKECKIEFVVGPFGPGETGHAKLYYDDVFISEYDYRKDESGGLQVYDVLDLCKFVGTENKLEAVQPIATFIKH